MIKELGIALFFLIWGWNFGIWARDYSDSCEVSSYQINLCEQKCINNAKLDRFEIKNKICHCQNGALFEIEKADNKE